jgi:hypothetical protein
LDLKMLPHVKAGWPDKFVKITQNVAQPDFWQNKCLTYTFPGEKSSPKIWATSIFIKKLPKINNHPMGENSPNLVTLRKGHKSQSFRVG